MVRTQPYGSEDRIDGSRILGYAAAIALHALALLLLLIPMTAPQLRPATATPKPEIRWIEREKPKTVPIAPKPATPEPIRKRTDPVVAPVPTTPTAPTSHDPVIVDHGTVATQPTDSGPATTPDPATGGPVPRSSLGYVKAPPPPYPRPEMMDGVQGTVVLRVLVGIDGVPLEVSVETSSGNRALDQSALRHVKKAWRFQPAMQDGRPVQAYGLVPIVFALR